MSPYTQDIIVNCGIDIIVAVGLYITVLSGQLSAGHAALMGIGGYASGLLLTHTTLSLAPGLALALIAGFASGGLLAAGLLRLDGLYMPIGTIAAAQALVNVATNTSFLGGADGLTGIPLDGGVKLSVISALVVITGTAFWERSIGGLKTRALGQDSLAAQVCGVRKVRVRLMAFAVGGALAAYAGALSAGNTGIVTPDSLGFLAAVVLFFYIGIGGITSYAGAVVGALLVTVLPELLRFSIYDRYLYFGVALVVILILRPRGIVPRIPLGAGRRLVGKLPWVDSFSGGAKAQ